MIKVICVSRDALPPRRGRSARGRLELDALEAWEGARDPRNAIEASYELYPHAVAANPMYTQVETVVRGQTPRVVGTIYSD